MKADDYDEDEKEERRDHVALEITQLLQEVENPTTPCIRAKLEAISFPCSIFSVPIKFLTQNEDAYHPKMVSIGPFHHGRAHLQPMEHHKWQYLNSLLSRNFTLDSSLDSCIEALRELEPKIRGCYQKDFPLLRSNEFVTMILLDSGFIIELLLRYSIRGLRRRDDPLFRSPEKFHILRQDLILLENQIPFFVLRRIFSLVPLPKQCDRSLSELCLRFFKNLIPGDVELLQEKYNFEGSNHLLDLLWKCHIPSSSKIPMGSGTDSGRELHSASKLQKSGIKVKKTDAESILDVKFIDGKLLIPRVKIHNYMETLFRNLVAMEHCVDHDKTKHVTSYIYLMQGLLRSNNDVGIFARRGIFVNYIEKEENVVDLFKKLCKDVELDKFYYEGMWEQLKGYGRTKWEVWRYNLKRKRRQTQHGSMKIPLVVSFVVLVLIGILFVVIYFFVRHNHRS